MPQGPTLVSKADYLPFTAAWQQLAANANLNQYFQVGNNTTQPVYGIRFPVSSIKALLSTVGLKRINAKFCIENGRFNMILFGTYEGSILTAYYLGTPSVTPPGRGGSDGNVSRWLAREWINNWSTYVTTPGNILTTATQFLTKYGTLNGYTYELGDVLDAMYKGAESAPDASYLLMHFTLHQYYREDAVNAGSPVSTFDLVLQRVDGENGGGGNPGDNENPYYDLTTPCPPICG